MHSVSDGEEFVNLLCLLSLFRLISARRPSRPVDPQLPVLYTQHPHGALQRQLRAQPQHNIEHQPQFQPELQLSRSLFFLHRFVC